MTKGPEPAAGTMPLALTSGLHRVPEVVVQLIGQFVAYPDQVSFAATSHSMRGTMNRPGPYPALHKLVSTSMSQQQIARRELLSIELNLRRLVGYSLNDANPMRATAEDYYHLDVDLDLDRGELLTAYEAQDSKLRQLGAALRAQLTEQVNIYLRDQSPVSTRAHVHACDQFVAASNPAAKQRIYEEQIRPLISAKDPFINLDLIGAELEKLFAERNFDQMQSLVQKDLDPIRSIVAKEMINSWTLQLAAIFMRAQPPLEKGQ
jgi:hypothetical protein